MVRETMEEGENTGSPMFSKSIFFRVSKTRDNAIQE